MREVMNLFIRTVRYNEWGSTKLFECVIILFMGHSSFNGDGGLSILGASIVFVASYLALGYYINDISDLTADKKADKDRGFHHLTRRGAIITGTVLWAVNITSLFFIHPKHLSLFMIGCLSSYLVMLGYSLPPMRFKERGLAGLITAAIGQRTLPAIVLISVMKDITTGVLLYLALLTINGLHWIIIHQAIDLKNDEKSGIKTYILQKSASRLKRIMIYAVFPTEVVLGILLTFCFINEQIFWVLIVYWAGLPVFTYLWSRIIETINFFSYDYVPGDNFLFLVLPLSILIAYSFSNPAGWVVVITALVVKWKYLLWQSGNAVALIKMSWNRGFVKIDER